MKPKLVCIAVLFLVVAAPGWQRAYSYDNGPINGTTDAWTINFGYVVSDSFIAVDFVGGFSFGVWEFPGDHMTSVQWSISGGPLQKPVAPYVFAGKVYESGTASGSSLIDQFISVNQYGYDVDLIIVTGLGVSLNEGDKYWLNLFNASVPSGDPVYWDENSGRGCSGSGCPSQAYDSAIGTIPSEAFTIGGCGLNDKGGCAHEAGGGAPEPGSILLFGSGVLGLTGLLRRKLNL